MENTEEMASALPGTQRVPCTETQATEQPEPAGGETPGQTERPFRDPRAAALGGFCGHQLRQTADVLSMASVASRSLSWGLEATQKYQDAGQHLQGEVLLNYVKEP